MDELQLLRVQNPAKFDENPEAAMGLHFGRDVQSGDLYFVIGSVVALTALPDEFEEIGPSIRNYLRQEWHDQSLSVGARSEGFETWLANLPNAPKLDYYRLSPRGIFRSPPWRPSTVYGHLPFETVSSDTSVFYRWEPFPVSRRITRTATGADIAPGTFGGPPSEVPFNPTGLCAVARFALPNLMPASYRWEIQPQAGTVLYCGASVPLYGQSGGGVEVMFPDLSHNRCPMADPVVLPQL